MQVRRTFFYNINYSIPFICTLQAEFFLLHFLAVLPSYNCIFLRVYCKLLLLWRLSKVYLSSYKWNIDLYHSEKHLTCIMACHRIFNQMFIWKKRRNAKTLKMQAVSQGVTAKKGSPYLHIRRTFWKRKDTQTMYIYTT